MFSYIIRVCTKLTFFAHRIPFLFRPRVFSRALGCGARRGPAWYTGRKFGARPGSVARARGVQSRESWQVITGSLSVEPEPNQAHEDPQAGLFFLLHLCCCFCSAVWALKSRENWQVIAESLSVEPEPNQAHGETPRPSLFFFFKFTSAAVSEVVTTAALKRLGSRGATAALRFFFP